MPSPAEQLLATDGPVARALGGQFEARPEQLRMAAAVDKALAERSHLLIEAGTGVGKSFGYLVPAMLRAMDHGETVLIATNTISLQEQLVHRDLPLLADLLDPARVSEEGDPLPRKVRPVLVKGRGNYVSIRRLKLASERQERLLPDPASRRSLHVIEDWAYETKDGTLSTLPQLERPGVWDKVQSDSGNCMGRKCPNYQECFYQSARRAMEGANILVCNHALFFSDLALRSQDVGFLPKYDHVILDEAHGAEDAAADHFGISLSEGRVQHLLTTLYHPRTGRGYLPQIALSVSDTTAIERAIRLVTDAMDAARVFFDQLADAAEKTRPREDAGIAVRAGAFGAARRPPAAARVRAASIVPDVLSPAMNALSLRLRALRDEVTVEADRYELNAYAIRAAEVAADCSSLLQQALPGYAYWIEVSGPGDEGGPFTRVTLACSPIDVAPLLKERLFAKEHSVVLTSATLATRRVSDDESTESAETAFAHTMSRLGCEGARTMQLGSPFDHATQAELVIDLGVGTPEAGRAGASSVRSFGGGSRYNERLAARIQHHVQETDGGAFVLFTSFATLHSVARLLRPRFAAIGLPLLAQGMDGSRTVILEQFRQDERSVLFGAASFWQGVDVRGRGLRNVIITKLPFEPPDRPLTEARLEAIRDRGGDPFREDSLPRAVMKFKQGFGRLIRSRSDAGRVVVLDSRLIGARYGREFLRALPVGLPVRVVKGESGDPDSAF